MDLKNLMEHHEELITHLQNCNYPKYHTAFFRYGINRICMLNKERCWGSYGDICLELSQLPYPMECLDAMHTVIKVLEQFDLHGLLPDRKYDQLHLKKGAYHHLLPEFRTLVDFYCSSAAASSKQASTVYTESHAGASFLLHLQKTGCRSLAGIREEQVLSFFLSGKGEPIKSCSYKKDISAVFKSGLAWKEAECRKVLDFLPPLREIRKNIQYLTQTEARKFRDALADEQAPLTFCDRAVGMLLLYTGLRGCDIAGMTQDSIDWQKEQLSIRQQKTQVLLELPLRAPVGNAIYDYLRYERPDPQAARVFLRHTRPYPPLESADISLAVSRIMEKAGIRQGKGDRKGTHIFRHHVATGLLGNGVPWPVVSRTLGHTATRSLEPYLYADLPHLKECALSISPFPLNREVFPYE